MSRDPGKPLPVGDSSPFSGASTASTVPAEERAALGRILGGDDSRLDLSLAAIELGRFAHPLLDAAAYLRRLDELGSMLRRRLGMFAAREPLFELRVLRRLLAEEQGYAGDLDGDADDPRDYFLHQVLDRRLGAALTLGMLYIEVGRRAGLSLAGVAFPGHFLVRFRSPAGEAIIDPFFGGDQLSADDLRNRIQSLAGTEVELSPEHLYEPGRRELLLRLLSSLRALYLRAGDVQLALAAAERMCLVDPTDRELALVAARLRQRWQARLATGQASGA
jgi:regulator of sirC expression with transglutaminase-like and TPR domain